MTGGYYRAEITADSLLASELIQNEGKNPSMANSHVFRGTYP